MPSTLGPASPLTITGLVNGQTYVARVRARNAAGWGQWSAPSAPFVPAATFVEITPTLAGHGALTSLLYVAGTFSATLNAVGTMTATIRPVPSFPTTLAGVGQVTATIKTAALMVPTLAGVGRITATLGTPGHALDLWDNSTTWVDSLLWGDGGITLSANASDIETSAAAWSAANAGTTISRSTTVQHAGAASLAVVRNDTTTKALARLVSGERIACVAGQSYTATCQATSNSTDGGRVGALSLEWYNAGGTLLSTTVGTDVNLETGVWEVLAATGTAPTGAVTMGLAFGLGAGDPSTSFTLYGDEFAIALSTDAGWQAVVNTDFASLSALPAGWTTYSGGASWGWYLPSHVTVGGGVATLIHKYDTSGPATTAGNGGTARPGYNSTTGAGFYQGAIRTPNALTGVDYRITVRQRRVNIAGTFPYAWRNMPLMWPNSNNSHPDGEDDLMESGGDNPATYNVNIHYGPTYPGSFVQTHWPTIDDTAWHIYRFQRLGQVLTWWVDDMVAPFFTHTYTTTELVPTVKHAVWQQDLPGSATTNPPVGTTGEEHWEISSIVIEEPS
jgi:hypothetical protein